jgi:hypothetical protein
MLVEKGIGHARLQPLLGIAMRGVADELLLVGQLRVQVERVRPVERGDCGFAHLVSAQRLPRST